MQVNSVSFKAQPQVAVVANDNVQVKNSNNVKTNNLQGLDKDVVEIKGSKLKSAKGDFADKKFAILCNEGWNSRTLNGKVGETEFVIHHDGNFFKSDKLTGLVNDKKIDLAYKQGFSHNTLSGKIGDENVNLKYSQNLSGVKISGDFKGKPISFQINNKMNGFSVKGEDINLRLKGKWFGNDMNMTGEYKADPDLIPIMLEFAYILNDDMSELALLMMV